MVLQLPNYQKALCLKTIIFLWFTVAILLFQVWCWQQSLYDVHQTDELVWRVSDGATHTPGTLMDTVLQRLGSAGTVGWRAYAWPVQMVVLGQSDFLAGGSGLPERRSLEMRMEPLWLFWPSLGSRIYCVASWWLQYKVTPRFKGTEITCCLSMGKWWDHIEESIVGWRHRCSHL